MTIKERLQIIKNKHGNKTINLIRKDIESYSFNHPFYCSKPNETLNEAKHSYLDYVESILNKSNI
jgi:hypothetical protein